MTTDDSLPSETFDLSVKFGPLIGNDDLANVLGFKTIFAFRAAIRRKTIGVNTFKIEGRRGSYAYTRDVEKWLSTLNQTSSNED